MKRRLIMWLMRQRLVQAWLLYAARPEASPVEIKWTKEDATVIENFLENATGQKLMAELENLKADYDAAAILRSNEKTVWGHVCVARGVRVTVARIKQLTAVRQTPDTDEDKAVSLPPDLEHLSET